MPETTARRELTILVNGSVVLAVLVAALVLLFGSNLRGTRAAAEPGAASTTSSAPEHSSRARIEELLGGSRVVATRPQVPGYDRECGPTDACVFGTAWTDDTQAPESHNGCDTRNDVLRRDLDDVRTKDGTNGCKVVAGHFIDPYAARPMNYATEGSQIQIDHLFPLAAAWDLGASAWTPERRRTFANDVTFELLAVQGSANQSKGDSTPASWLPPNKSYRCRYVATYLAVAQHYDLAVTAADVTVIRAAARRC